MNETFSNGYMAVPKTGKGPGILILHAWWGLNKFFRDFCDRLAEEGYVALAPDLYHGETANTVPDAKKLRSTLKQKQVGTDILSAIDYLHKFSSVSGKSLGVIGFSLGAHWALWASLEKPDTIKAVTIFYGTKNAEYTSSKAAYLGHFAETDEWVAASGVKKLEKNLQKAKCSVEFYIYENTAHWFFEKDRKDAYNAKAAQLAWDRTLEFLHKQLQK